jgi:2-polyprenyl-3-methyl-5-hydroxy-6-metoxy-1,4-benzoquinol methylase
MTSRLQRELEHGRRLAGGIPEDTWGWGSPAGQVRARRRAALIAQGAGLAPGVSALEVGCGTGLFTELLAATGARIVALEPSQELIAEAQARPPLAEAGEQGRVTFLCAALEDEAALRGPFDAVVGSSVLHHLELPAALRRAFGLLRPGGALSFAEPSLCNPQVFAERTFRPLFPSVSPDETAFVRWTLVRELRRAGFEAVEVEPFDFLHPATPAALIAAVSRVGALLEAVPGLRELAGSLAIRARRPWAQASGSDILPA